MSDNDKAFGFGAFVPGFDFLQGLVKSAASSAGGGMPQGAPDWSKWVAPTLQADEIEKRIGELKTVQFWLEQNARALAATIQALEVQKMTLATLRGMNLQVNDMAQAFSFARPGAAGATASAATAARPSGSGAYDDMYTHRPADPMPAAHAEPPPDAAAATPAPPPAGPGAPPAVDPLQWWGALAGQFQQIAAGAMQDAAEQARLSPAIDLQDAARKAFEAAGRMGAEVAAAAASTASVAPAAPAKKRAAPRKAAASAPVAPVARPVARKAAARKKPAKPAPRRAGR